ncbi:hypothetical protein [Raoultella planticola]|mgnify:CR=1 FL=1|jgi:hypothetical protein|uniref:Uncharacterized protein n=1 Tax=Raoultella planticola TaxID=575 RepID=A0AAN5KUP0_RAOPL|nr:hypothetical protein [Raoultella planticola]EJR0223652.1 hypothetical protein [Raoultella planticola]EJR0352786.1 hypothetical protein [Raoultella planticola]EMD1840557.1 hypothetical protein [Raoultella planticola]MCE9859688.1 hypothetical protein [Raoultella planticola]MDV1448565.1 hypothetical protein [Raoultella planticola]
MLITVLVKPKMFRMFTDILSVVFRPEPAEGYACITIDPPHSETEFFYGSLYL